MGSQETTIIRMFGVTAQGNSVMTHVYNFRPYFYVELPKGMNLSPAQISLMKNDLNSKFTDQSGQDSILDLEIEKKQSLLMYRDDTEDDFFLKIYTRFPSDVNKYKGE